MVKNEVFEQALQPCMQITTEPDTKRAHGAKSSFVRCIILFSMERCRVLVSDAIHWSYTQDEEERATEIMCIIAPCRLHCSLEGENVT